MNTPILLLLLAPIQTQPSPWTEGPALPVPVANNAVVATHTRDGPAVFTFLGLDASKAWNGTHTRAFRWLLRESAWTELPPIPGPGRLAGTAQAVAGQILVLGGYTVQEDGSETSVPNVDIYDPVTNTWSDGAPIPVPSDDAVSGIWRDSLVYLISGWHDRDNIPDVQIFDAMRDQWMAATRIPGPPVFGHAGAIAGNAIIYIDGVRTNSTNPRFSIEASSWRGDIDPNDPTSITWQQLPDHPGPPLYRAAAGVVGQMVVFGGGTDNPYNYNGVGYDGVPSEPRTGLFGFDLSANEWMTLAPLPVATMDHRAIAVIDGRLVIVGGMEAGQRVTARVAVADAAAVIGN